MAEQAHPVHREGASHAGRRSANSRTPGGSVWCDAVSAIDSGCRSVPSEPSSGLPQVTTNNAATTTSPQVTIRSRTPHAPDLVFTLMDDGEWRVKWSMRPGSALIPCRS